MDIILNKILSIIGNINECKDDREGNVMLSESNEREHLPMSVRLLMPHCVRRSSRQSHPPSQDDTDLPHCCAEVFTSVAGNLLRMTEKKGKNIYFSVMTILTLLFFFATPCFAYVEEVEGNRTQMTAGDQNTAMYRLQARSKTSLKHLKKIDEMMARSPDAGDGSAKNVAEVSMLIKTQENAAIRDQVEKMKSAEKLLQNKSDLRRRQGNVTPQTIDSLATSQIRDENIAAELWKLLPRRNQ